MYYRKVNRGVILTRPGRYTIALLLALGVIAIASGYNGVYLSLSVGASILLVSGVLSERFMKAYEVLSLQGAVADAHSPFTLECVVRNGSDSDVVYGMENLFYSAPPRLRWFREDHSHQARSLVLIAAPGGEAKVACQCGGLPRGTYPDWYVVQRTLYPFALLSKFKVSHLPVEVAVLPAPDRELAERLRRELRLRLRQNDSDSEFYSHRLMLPKDPAKHVDWKRSAGRPREEWLVKVRQSPAQESGVRIRADWGEWKAAETEARYESALSLARTVCDVVREAGREIVLEISGLGSWRGYEASVRALAALEPYGRRESQRPPGGADAELAGPLATLLVRGGEVRWGEEP